MKDILLAEKAGFCFGVQRAVDTALKCQKDYNKIVYTLGPLIHNNDVVKYLRENKVNPIDLENIDILGEGDVIIIRSHGVKPSVISLLKEKKLEIVDATCPYVSNIHKKVSKYYESGYDIVIVGDKNHPEVVGINGWCNDTAIIATKGELIDENLLKNKKICLVSQTTEKQGNFNSVLEKLQSLTDELVYFNTICNATEVRQKAANELSKKVDLMVVLGGKNSSNTTKLFEICSKNCENTIHVENAGEIPDYIINLKNINNIGVTAGASTPDWIIEEAVNKMNLADNKELNEFEQLLAEYDSNIHTGKKVKGIVETITEDEAYVSIVGYKGNGLLKLRDVTLNENEDLRNLLSLGEEIITKVIKVDHKDDIVYLSKIQIDREEGLRELEEAYKSKTPVSLKVLKVVKGGVTSNFKGVSVFVPASQLDGRRVENIQDFVGKTIETLIIEFAVDKKYPKVVASRRALMPVTERPRRDDSKAFETLEKDTIVKGVVKRITDFGAFVEVNGVDGLLHLSQISWQKINKVSDVLAIGDNIDVYILDVDKEHRKLSLSLKKLKKSPWDTVKETYNVGDIIPCEVLRFTDFGAFVRVEAGVDGLVHISKISKERVEKPSDVLAIGQKINCKILELDADSKKISLSIKDADN